MGSNAQGKRPPAQLPQMPYTPQQVADALGCSRETVYREIRSGRLRARHRRGESKLLFITSDDLARWSEEMLED